MLSREEQNSGLVSGGPLPLLQDWRRQRLEKRIYHVGRMDSTPPGSRCWSSRPPKASPTVWPAPMSRPPASSSWTSPPPRPSTSVRTTWPSTVLPALRSRRSSSATTTSTPAPARSRHHAGRSQVGRCRSRWRVLVPPSPVHPAWPKLPALSSRETPEGFLCTLSYFLLSINKHIIALLTSIASHYYRFSFCTRYLIKCMSRSQSYREIRVLEIWY